jgi:hypothetical protein
MCWEKNEIVMKWVWQSNEKCARGLMKYPVARNEKLAGMV